MHDEVAASEGCGMHGLPKHIDAAEPQPAEFAQPLVMVAGDEDDPRPLAGLAQQLLQHIIVGLGPMGSATDLPEVDDVADKVNDIGLDVLEQIQQSLRLRGPCAQMYVGEEKRPMAGLIQLGWHGLRLPPLFPLAPHQSRIPITCM